MPVRRYHSVLVVLHWLLAAGVIFMLLMGTFALNKMPNSAPDKIGALQGHMVVGMAIGVLTLLRLVTRLTTAHPPPASTGNPMLDKLGTLAHWTLYLLVFVMAASGFGTALLAGLPDIVFGGIGSLPADFKGIVPRTVHGIVAKLLMLVIALHIAAALWHQFVRRDGLLSRMRLGPR